MQEKNSMGPYMYFEIYEEMPFLDIAKEEDIMDIKKYSKILFFQSQEESSRFNILSPELNIKIAQDTGRNNSINEKEAEKISRDSFCKI